MSYPEDLSFSPMTGLPDLLSLPPYIELADLFTTVIVVITMFFSTPNYISIASYSTKSLTDPVFP